MRIDKKGYSTSSIHYTLYFSSSTQKPQEMQTKQYNVKKAEGTNFTSVQMEEIRYTYIIYRDHSLMVLL